MAEFSILRAAEEGHLERVRQLIDGGVSVDSRDDYGQTPLHLAAEKGRFEVAELLISRKCDLNLKDGKGRTPVMCAARMAEKNVVDLLLQRGAQVHCTDYYNKWTLLHFTSLNGWTDTVHHILGRAEADPYAASKHGCPPLILAARGGHEDVAALLIRAGAEVNRSGEDKWTALHWAAALGFARVVRVLLEEEGLDLNPQDEFGETPLHKACYRGRRDVVEQLLVAGADTTLKNNEGETALSVGIRRGELTLQEIKLFVQHNAFLQDCDYVHISQNPVLKESVLKDVGLCAQSIVNKFHCQSLPALGSSSYFARKLPNIDKFELNARQIDEVENLVKCEIERNAFCNVVKVHPMALSALCVLSLINCRSGTKQSASPDLCDSLSSFKKLHA